MHVYRDLLLDMQWELVSQPLPAIAGIIWWQQQSQQDTAIGHRLQLFPDR